MFRFLLLSDWGLGSQGLRVLGKLGFCSVFGISSARNCIFVWFSSSPAGATHAIPGGERDGVGIDVRTAMQWQVHCSSLSDQSAGATTRHARHPHR